MSQRRYTDDHPTSTTTILVVDDHPIVRRGLSLLLSVERWVGDVYEADSVESAVREAVLHDPQLVTLDLRLGDGDGVDATRRLLAAKPGLIVVIVTMVADDDEVARALRAGARGYVLKSSSPEDVCAALSLARRGGLVLGPGLGPGAITAEPVDALPAPFNRLTTRERVLAQRLALGEPNLRIARALGVSEKTVRNQISSLLVKLGVPDRVAAALLARDAGLGEPEPRSGRSPRSG